MIGRRTVVAGLLTAAAAAALVAALVAVLAAVAGVGPVASEARAVGASRPVDDPPRGRARGVPAGRPNSEFSYEGALFAARCAFSHAAPDDPIVFPDRPGLSHRHDFFGAAGTDARSTARSLRRDGRTTCDVAGDTASYWAPSLLRDGVPITPDAADAYYRVAPGVRAARVQPYPDGLAMIAGDAHAEAALPTSIVGWGCGRSPAVTSTIPDCPIERPLTLRVTFPDCWNGSDLDSPEHVAHVAYSSRRGCPGSFPVPVPRLTLVVGYPVTGDPTGLEPASGSAVTAHADFLNAWDEAALARNVRSCLRRAVVCSVP